MGGVLTENYATNFHTFASRVILKDPSEAERYREVTAAEKMKIEAEDIARQTAKYPQAFIDRWDSDFGELGGYDMVNAPDAKHPFRAYDLWLTYEEALIVDRWSIPLMQPGTWPLSFDCQQNLRTLKPFGFKEPNQYIGIGLGSMRNKTVETLYWPHVSLTGGGSVWMMSLRSLDVFKFAADSKIDAPNLENFTCNFLNGHYWRANVSFPTSSKLTMASVKCLVDVMGAKEGNAVVITVHPDVYAKLTDESNAEWNQLLKDAALKNISFASA